jgi:signal transduction histidine kinase
VIRQPFAPLVDRRTWREFLYALIGLPLGIAGFVFVVVSLSLSAGLAITVVGILILAVAVSAARTFTSVYRDLGRGLLGIDVEKPLVDRRRSGIFGYVTERTGWRALLFLLLRFPLAILDFTVAVTVWASAVGCITYPLWHLLVPDKRDRGVEHRGTQLAPHHFLDRPVGILVVFVTGIVLVLIAPWVLRGLLSVDRLLIRGLLGPTSSSKRIKALEDTRAMAVDNSAASLRRIERDLHDGAQARLVSLAMSLGLAKEELAKDAEPGEAPDAALERVRELVNSAHREAKGTIVDLRDLARGIHPPALDNGLPDALATLAARCAIPTTLHIDLPDRPSRAIETIVYFCTAELLTNAVKHSGAHHASVDVRCVGDHLFVRASDNGAGGAALGRAGGTGLAGLSGRVATVDGRLDISSPEGGPTLVTIDIPLERSL